MVLAGGESVRKLTAFLQRAFTLPYSGHVLAYIEPPSVQLCKHKFGSELEKAMVVKKKKTRQVKIAQNQSQDWTGSKIIWEKVCFGRGCSGHDVGYYRAENNVLALWLMYCSCVCE